MRDFDQTIGVSETNRSLYSVVQQEVETGAQALKRESVETVNEVKL